MKKSRILLAIFTVLSLVSCGKSQTTKAFSTETLSEKLISSNKSEIDFDAILKQHLGKTILIEVWATWCSDCINNMPKIKELQTNHPEVEFVFISADKSVQAWQKGIKKYKLQGSHYMLNDGMKGTFGKSIDLNWIPRYLVINAQGEIEIYKAIETNYIEIDTKLKELNQIK
jgi:thiol-disulfide isomerase/thioredoxin